MTHRKTTLKFIEYGGVFYHDESGSMYWLHHLALGGFLHVHKRGTLKRNTKEEDEEEDGGYVVWFPSQVGYSCVIHGIVTGG